MIFAADLSNAGIDLSVTGSHMPGMCCAISLNVVFPNSGTLGGSGFVGDVANDENVGSSITNASTDAMINLSFLFFAIVLPPSNKLFFCFAAKHLSMFCPN